MNDLPGAAAVLKSAWRDFRQAWRGLIVFAIVFKLAEAWLLVPAVAWALSFLLARTGRAAVSNRDILDFLLTPWGLLYAALFATVSVGFLLLELAGLMAVAHAAAAPERPPLSTLLLVAVQKMWRVAQLGATMAALLAAAAIPLVLAAGLTYLLLLTRYDIYFYWKERPPVFWLAVGLGAVLLAIALAGATWLQVRWSLALPILLWERHPAAAALRLSRDRTRGARGRIARILLGWLGASLVAGWLTMAVFQLAAAAALQHGGERPIVLILGLLIVQGGLLAAWSFVTVVGLALLTRRLYLSSKPESGVPGAEQADSLETTTTPGSHWTGRLAYLLMALVGLAPVALWAELAQDAPDGPPVAITAHRGHARAAPENTLSAIRKAIESGADYAEIDVQQTADGAIVLLHDRDLRRVAGDSRRLADVTLEELQQLDAGRWFSPAFAGERVPTLREAIALSRGKIKLNVELKFYSPDRQLVPAVARLLQEQQFESECLVTTLQHDALLEVRRTHPRLRTGLIVAQALGNLNRLEFDALSVRADFLTGELLRSAHRQNREVHVWTVNDPRQMSQMLELGVDNLITSDPDLAIRVRNQWHGLTPAERLVLSARLLLGIEPAGGSLGL